MSVKEIYRDDLLNRYVSHTFLETPVGSMTLVEFRDAGVVTIASAQTLVVDDAYRTIREDLIGFGEVIITIDETQRDALTSTTTGTLIYNTDGTVEIYTGSDWDAA